MFFGKWKHTLNLLSKQPPSLILQDLLSKIPYQPLQFARFFLLKLKEEPPVKLRGFGTVRAGTVADIPEMCSLEGKDEELFEERFRTGDSCAVAVDDGAVVGYLWYSRQAFHVEQRFKYLLSIPDDALYSYDCFIDYRYRLRGVWLILQKHMLEECLKLGRKEIITIVDLSNKGSLKAHARLGFSIYGSVLYVRFFKHSLFLCSRR